VINFHSETDLGHCKSPEIAAQHRRDRRERNIRPDTARLCKKTTTGSDAL